MLGKKLSVLLSITALATACGGALADPLYQLQVDPGRVSFGGSNAPTSQSGSWPGSPRLQIADASGFRVTHEQATLVGGFFHPTLSTSGSLTQSTQRDDSQQFNTLANAQGSLNIQYWAVAHAGAPTGVYIPVLVHATGGAGVTLNDGSAGGQAHIGSFGMGGADFSQSAARQCGFDGNGVSCSTISPDFNYSTSFLLDVQAMFGFFLNASNYIQADFPAPGFGSSQAQIHLDVTIDPSWQYASFYHLSTNAPGGGGQGQAPAPAPLALIASGLALLALARRKRA
jgi:hypothetical protein